MRIYWKVKALLSQITLATKRKAAEKEFPRVDFVRPTTHIPEATQKEEENVITQWMHRRTSPLSAAAARMKNQYLSGDLSPSRRLCIRFLFVFRYITNNKGKTYLGKTSSFPSVLFLQSLPVSLSLFISLFPPSMDYHTDSLSFFWSKSK